MEEFYLLSEHFGDIQYQKIRSANPVDTRNYTFIFKDTDGKETTVKYYEYDTNFYAAVVEDKVYLVNKMNVKDLDEAYQKMMNPDTEDAEESISDTATEEN